MTAGDVPEEINISIHALVKRATVTVSEDAIAGDISIHALVKRATVRNADNSCRYKDFNPRPREEGDPRYVDACVKRWEFQSTPS